MAETSLIEIFDLCVERLAAGETVEDCLHDYPDVADQLRGMLEMGALLFQTEADTHTEQQAQAHTRPRIEAALQTDFAPRKGKNSMVTMRRSMFWAGGAAAAVFALTFGFALATTPPSHQYNIVADSTLPDFDGDGLSNQRESEYRTNPNLADSDSDGLIDGDEVYVWATNPLLRDTDADGWSDGDEVNTRGTNPNKSDLTTPTPRSDEDPFILTATQYVLEITQTAYLEAMLTVRAETPIPDSILNPGDAMMLTATQLVKEITQTAEVAMTTTSIAIMPLQPMGTPTAPREFNLPTQAPLATAFPTLESAAGVIVPTSVAGYLPMTATMVLPGTISSSADKEKDATSSSEGKPLLAEPERERTDTDTDEYSGEGGEGRTLADGVLAPASSVDGDGTAEEPAISIDAAVSSTVVATYGTRGTELNASIVLGQEQLNPMKAGEIDDNAEWDTYMEFRHNFINTFGSYSVIDMDVSGRRIIKVVDAMDNPILGARVLVTAPDFSVETRTYATGMTLFFPNADESTKRRDEFQIIVSYDQYQAYYTLNLRKVGDSVEIQMPIVILRDGTVAADMPLADVYMAATGAAKQADEAATSAYDAFMAATKAAEDAVEAANRANDAFIAATMTAQAANNPAAVYSVTPFPTYTPLP